MRDLLFYLFINFTKICRLVFELCLSLCVCVCISSNGKRLKGNPTLEICLYIVTIYIVYIDISHSHRIGSDCLRCLPMLSKNTYISYRIMYFPPISHTRFSIYVSFLLFLSFFGHLKSMTVYNYNIII